ncbi:BRO family protein [Pseudomonas solani]|uniref:BRO family protein n=1 Tax=Pseudomonas solani TaxID=2731552 RepID=UPI003C2F0A0C
MKFLKQSFMDIELDILTGCPEHGILFIATQVARVAGLKSASQSVAHVRTRNTAGHLLHEIQGDCIFEDKPLRIRKDAVMFSEPETYQMLLRGHAPQSEPFRKWVTGVVRQGIRKTGKFDVNEAQDESCYHSISWVNSK